MHDVSISAPDRVMTGRIFHPVVTVTSEAEAPKTDAVMRLGGAVIASQSIGPDAQVMLKPGDDTGTATLTLIDEFALRGAGVALRRPGEHRLLVAVGDTVEETTVRAILRNPIESAGAME